MLHLQHPDWILCWSFILELLLVLQIDPMLKLSELICNQIVVCLIHIENVLFFLNGKTLLLQEQWLLKIGSIGFFKYIYYYKVMMKATRGRSVSSVSFHLVLPQMIWLGQHWSQRHRMRGLLTLCIPLSWLQASLTQPSLTQRPPLQPQPSTPRWGTNRCVSFFPFLFKHPHLNSVRLMPTLWYNADYHNLKFMILAQVLISVCPFNL